MESCGAWAQDIATLPDLCKRVRFRRSNCQRCGEICPDDAISLEPGPVVSDRCSDCGLCQNACPTCEKRQVGLAHQSKNSRGKTEESREVAIRRMPRAIEVVP